MCCISRALPDLAEQVLLAISDANTGHVLRGGGGRRVGALDPQGCRSTHYAHSLVSVSRVEHAPHCIKSKSLMVHHAEPHLAVKTSLRYCRALHCRHTIQALSY